MTGLLEQKKLGTKVKKSWSKIQKNHYYYYTC